MTFATLLAGIAAELALFSAVGFLLFAVNDLLVDIIYIARRLWRSATVYRRYPRGSGFATTSTPTSTGASAWSGTRSQPRGRH